MCHAPAPARGFTLLEAVVAVAIAGLLLAVAVPVWSGTMARVHSTDAQGRMTTTLIDSMRHATVTGAEVVVCPSLDASTCSPGTDWSRGWIAFADLDGDRLHSDRETTVHREPALRGGVRLRSTTGRTRLVFQPDGRAAGSNVTFTLCDRRGPRAAISLVLNNHGEMHTSAAAFPAASACFYSG